MALPGWFGFGAAVEAFLSESGRRGHTLLRRMSEEWPFFRDVAVQHGHGAGQGRPGISPGATPISSRTARRPTRFRRDRGGMAACVAALEVATGRDAKAGR